MHRNPQSIDVDAIFWYSKVVGRLVIFVARTKYGFVNIWMKRALIIILFFIAIIAIIIARIIIIIIITVIYCRIL